MRVHGRNYNLHLLCKVNDGLINTWMLSPQPLTSPSAAARLVTIQALTMGVFTKVLIGSSKSEVLISIAIRK